MSKFKLILIFMGLLPAVSWAQGPCEFDVPLPNYYICYSENGIYLPILNQPTGTYSGEFVTPDGFFDVAEAGSGPHFVIYTADPAICFGTDTVDFIIIDQGFLEIEGGSTSICAGDSTTLSAPNALEYDWLGDGVRTNSFTFSPDTTTTYLVSGLDNSGCPNVLELTITVFQYGEGLTISGPSYVCYNDTVSYEVLGTTSVLWNDGSTAPLIGMRLQQDTLLSVYIGENPACDTTLMLQVDVAEELVFEYDAVNNLCYGELFQVYITGGNASYYKIAGQNFFDFTEFFLEDDALIELEAYNDSGCVATKYIQFQVNDFPVLNIDAPEQLCSENPLYISVSGAPVIEWLDLDSGSPVSLTGDNEYSVLASDSIRFQVTGISEFNCVTTELIEVPVYPTPDVRIDSLTAFCVNRDATVMVSGADFYVWNGLNITDTLSFPAVNDTVFTVLGSTVYGCFAYDTINITVHPNPEIWLTGEYYICELDTATLVGTGAYQYFWDGVEGTDTLNAMPSADSLFTLIGKNIFGCADTATYFVDVDPAPVITFIGDSDICVGDSVSLQMITDGLVFQWLGGSTQTIIPVDPADDTTYTVTAIGANGCPRTSSFPVTVHDYPILTISGNTIVCFGDSITLNAEGADVFSWNNGLQGATIVYVPVATGILRVDGNSNDCVTQELISITVNEYPSVQFTFNADTLCTSGGGASWIASPAGGELSGDGVDGNWFNLGSAVTGVNTVTYTVTNEYNCTASVSDQLIVQSCTDIEEDAQSFISVYPNPCADKLLVQVEGNETCTIVNSLGQSVWSGRVSGTATIETGNWSSGTYVLMSEGGIAQKIVKL
jgi:hypothetical protein